jgi:hypothetical protein
MHPLFVVGPVLSWGKWYVQNYVFLHCMPVDGVEYFSGFFVRERYVFKSFCKPPRYVPYKYTYVQYDGTFGMSNQGQMLDV